MIDAILTSTARALDRPQRVVIAHFGSILPKIGLTEADLPADGLDRLAAETARTGQEIEISERWRCPSAATLRPFLRHGVPIVLSTDSHRRETIGRYEHCLAVRRELQAGEPSLEWILTAFVIAGRRCRCSPAATSSCSPGLHRFRSLASTRRSSTSRTSPWSSRPGTRRP